MVFIYLFSMELTLILQRRRIKSRQILATQRQCASLLTVLVRRQRQHFPHRQNLRHLRLRWSSFSKHPFAFQHLYHPGVQHRSRHSSYRLLHRFHRSPSSAPLITSVSHHPHQNRSNSLPDLHHLCVGNSTNSIPVSGTSRSHTLINPLTITSTIERRP